VTTSCQRLRYTGKLILISIYFSTALTKFIHENVTGVSRNSVMSAFKPGFIIMRKTMYSH